MSRDMRNLKFMLSDLQLKDLNTRVYRDGSFEFAAFIDSKVENSIIFIEGEKYVAKLSLNVTCIICPEAITDKIPKSLGVLLSENPRKTFFNIHEEICNLYKAKGFKTIIGENCAIADTAIIDENNVIIGNGVVIEDRVIIKGRVTIGDNCIIRAGVVIGGEGFQFDKDNDNKFVLHGGGVIIEENVEIQYNSCVDKALFPWDNTILGKNVKIDNLVYVAHGVKIGSNTLIATHAAIMGSASIKENCWIGPGAVISNRVNIGKNSKVSLGAVVTKNVEDGVRVSGNFAIEHNKFINFIKKLCN